MNIIVCIKQVPDTTNVRIDPETNTLVREGVASIINPFDMYAIEEAIRIRERVGGKVIIITMGPPQAKDALKEAISMGADEAVLVSDRAFAGSDTWATSYTLSKAIEKIGQFDLILCGKQAIDGDTAQVGPGISAQLDIPQITYVKKTEDINPVRSCMSKETTASSGVKEGSARFERMTEEGYEVIEVDLPCLITVVKEINEPRLPSLKGKMRARSAEIPTWTINELDLDETKLGLKGSPTRVVKIFSPEQKRSGVMLTGEVHEVVAELAGSIKDIVTAAKGN